MGFEIYLSFIGTANLIAVGGLYKLFFEHVTDRKLHIFCGKEKTENREGYIMKKLMIILACGFVSFSGVVGCSHFAYVPATEETPSIVQTPIGDFETVETTNKMIDVATVALQVIGGSAALAAIPFVRKLKPIVPLLDALGGNILAAKNADTNDKKQS